MMSDSSNNELQGETDLPKGINKLAFLRNDKGFTVRSLAEAAKVAPSTIYKIEHGQGASLRTLVRLSKALGVKLGEVLELGEGAIGNGKNQEQELLDETAVSSFSLSSTGNDDDGEEVDSGVKKVGKGKGNSDGTESKSN